MRWLLSIVGAVIVAIATYFIIVAVTGTDFPTQWHQHQLGVKQHEQVRHLEQIADSVNDPYILGVYDCSDMVKAFWYKATTEGYKVKIVVGDPSHDISDIRDAHHAWCLVFMEGEGSSGWLAIEVTTAHAMWGEDNPRYYRGFFFDSPEELPGGITQ